MNEVIYTERIISSNQRNLYLYRMAYNLSPDIYQLNFIPHYLFVLRSSINFLLCFPTSYVNKVGLSFFEQYWKINVLNIYIYI